MAIGKSRKLISWDNLESIFIGKDIADEFHSLNGTFEEKLTKCADNYIEEIRGRKDELVAYFNISIYFSPFI